MPINEPNYLTPSGIEDEKTMDALKRWLSGDTSEVDFDAANTIELVMAAFTAVYHLSQDLLTHADHIVHQALTEERYGPMEITHGERVFRQGGGRMFMDWETMNLEVMAKGERVPLINILTAARRDVIWLRKQIRRLESFMERAREQKEMGYVTALRFEADERPDNQ
ncbi:hypothetical protein LTR91_020203 [Friedmanniomyces endolithicus]|uniref:Uncharacterized protein n=1 Tax=Friedmanniomyces endolithicus TaxID=329885 RepID=A0AAN6HCI1_9PEZI|nr:hypothetical protein LTR94_019474 [Friedmanniomyces endolithicus]KAK0774440.1 hypothetical protein LTR59_014879 [Friedmanniomyces endolithicus]KAK0802623.1 hypothetical protein LTR75_008194 [Friedmanniomyces endolithicus]KAK0807950.1 hypothetical protein LTR38_004767 [Friedmanniomyces endolithicus]KAK0834119.1 hypothetical protein LTR03_014582 [Friedmanniomyces endolithicus]